MESIKKVKKNLHLIGNKVYSYETHVATIEGQNLVEHGKYSQTTGRHINHIARMYNLNIIPAKKKAEFNKLHYGAVINL